MIVIIDNYDSFTYNLYQYIGEMQPNVVVFRNDEISITELGKLAIEQIIISPGPGYPSKAGISSEVMRVFGKTIPILGVCLGHQGLAHAFGGKIIEAPEIVHGKTSMIDHNGQGIFAGLPNPLQAMRYHSLIVSEEALPAELEVTARTQTGEIMGLSHKEYPIFGVQFHPESIKTVDGKQLLQNFLAMQGNGGCGNVAVSA